MKRTLLWPRWSLWTWCFALLMTAGIYAAYARIAHGAGSSIQFGNEFPWSLVIGLNVFCGIAIAVGGFTVAASVYVLNLEEYKPIVRASLVTSFLGYVVAVLGFLLDQTSSGHIASRIWRPHSILYGVAWAFILFALLLILEFAPELCERLLGRQPPRFVRSLSMPLLLVAVVFSVMYQTTLADLLQSVPSNVSPLWSTPQLPFLFFISAVCVGLAVVIFASWHITVASGKGLSPDKVARLGKMLAALLFLYLGLRIADLLVRGIPLLVWKNNPENLLLGLEMGLIFVPMALLISERNLASPRMIYVCAVMVLAGLITNRLNTCITSVETATGSRYLPTWDEFVIAYSIIALGVAVFSVIAKRLPVFAEP
jgi:Ni/Fe-hydrogenase subunit HybB-like protein